MPFTGAIEDRLAIHELVAAYADGITMQDIDTLQNLWAEDAEWRIPYIPGFDHIVGREAIIGAIKATLEVAPRMMIVASLGHLVVTGDKAEGRAYPRETIFEADGSTRALYGCYDDTYVKQDGAWLFQSRTFSQLPTD